MTNSASTTQDPAQAPANDPPTSLTPAQQKAQERIAAARARAAANKAATTTGSGEPSSAVASGAQAAPPRPAAERTVSPGSPGGAQTAAISDAQRAVGGSARAAAATPTPPSAPAVAPPSDDKRWRVVFATMRKHGFAANSLIETLHTAQESFGFLSDPALLYIARSLHLPPSRVYGVATFYNLFHLQPQGEHSCVICLGTACYIKGAAQIVSALEDATHVAVGETTADGKVSLLAARCLGACGLAPACVYDGEVVGKLESAAAVERLQRMTAPLLESAGAGAKGDTTRSVEHASG